MDPAVAWFQEEQNGPAKRIWLGIWETVQEMDQTQLAVNNNLDNNNKSAKDMNLIENQHNINCNSNGQTERTYYNPSRRKAGSTLESNRASTFNMNRYESRLIGKHGGCPWRPSYFKYGPGVLG